MAKIADMHVRIKTNFSLWDAIKIRIAGIKNLLTLEELERIRQRIDDDKIIKERI